MFERILVAVDGSEHALKAVDFAVDLAQKYGAELVVVSIYRPLKVPDSTHSLVRARATAQSAGDLKALAKEVVDEAVERADKLGVPASGLVERGHPARTIVETAEKVDADVIVLGSRGLGDIGGMLLGSVSHKVSSLAKCSVVIIK
jgi:nucleotide-binding universal stress UspA family protein